MIRYLPTIVFARVLGATSVLGSTNRIETTTSSRDISAQTTALLLSAVSIALATRSKSLTLLPVVPVRWTSWTWISSLRSQANISPSLSTMHLGTPAATYSLATHNHLLYSSCSLYPYRTGKLYFSAGTKNTAIIKNIMKKPTLIRFIQPPKFTASPGVIAGSKKSLLFFCCCFFLFFFYEIRVINTRQHE